MASQARILVIDDQPYYRRLIESQLAPHGSVVSVDGAAAAWALLEAEGPSDLVVMDLMLSDADGLETLVCLRQRWPGQHVVILSSTSDPRAVVAAMREGACDYLIKPIDCEGLPRAVDRALRQAQPRGPEITRPPETAALLERALDLLACRDRESVQREILEILCLQVGAIDGLLWSVDADRPALAAVKGALPDDGTAPQRPPVECDSEAGLRQGQPWLESDAQGRAVSLYVPCEVGGERRALVRLTARDGSDFSEAQRAACAHIGRIAGAALIRTLVMPAARKGFRDPDTGLPGPAFLEEVGRLEIQKAERYGRRVGVVCAEVSGLEGTSEPRVVSSLVGALQRVLRSTDALVGEGRSRFWVLVGDADPLGGVVLKRRLGQRLHATLRDAGVPGRVFLGAASYPDDADAFDALCERALARLREEREGLAPVLAIDEETPLAVIGTRLLERAMWLPGGFVGEAADLVVGDIGAHPRSRALLFLAPGQDRRPLLEPLSSLSETESATEIFVATDGETLPIGPSVTALGLPADVSSESTWIVRFGEVPPYALIAGAARSDGARPVFHTVDVGLVEHLAFRLRAEIGFGVRG